MCMWWCIHIFFLSFLPHYSNWDCASSFPWNEIAAWLSLFIAVVIIKMTLIMMIVIEWGWRCDAFVCVATDFPSSVQCFVFILWRNVMMVLWNEWVPIVFANRLCLLHLCFFVFSLEAVSPAFVLPSAAVLIVEAFVFVFVLRYETRRCVGCCYCFGVLLYHCVASIGLFLNEELSFSSQVMCFDLERAVPAFVFNVGGCFDTWNALLFHH